MEVVQDTPLNTIDFGGRVQLNEPADRQAPPTPTKKYALEKNQASDIKISHEKFMSVYKVSECKKKFNHDKRQCINWHSQADRRRNPYQIPYSTSECENGLYCKDYSKCLFAHNMLEKMFHPDLFKISRCIRGPNSTQCERGDFCAFAHSDEDLRQPSFAREKNNTNFNVGGRIVQPLSGNFDTEQRLRQQPQCSPSKTGNSSEGLSPSKPLTDSAALENIQRNLVILIRSQGSDGIISSELPKRYYDHFGTRLDLQDENGEKFRIKDILHEREDVTVSMHKGVQPKYVYSGPDPLPSCRATRVAPALTSIEDNAKASHLSFLEAASGKVSSFSTRTPSPPSETDYVNAAPAGISPKGMDGLKKAESSLNSPFSPSGVTKSHQLLMSGTSCNTMGRDSYSSSPFFAESSASTGSSSQNSLSGLLGNGGSYGMMREESLLKNSFEQDLLGKSVIGDSAMSSSSFLDDSFKYPLFQNELSPYGEARVNGNEGSIHASSKNELNRKDIEIEDLKFKLKEIERKHGEVCREKEQEKLSFQSQISQLTEKCATLEKRLSTTVDNSVNQFPQNTFPLSPSRQPFSPGPSSNNSWVSTSNANLDQSHSMGNFMPRSDSSQHGRNNVSGVCARQGCLAEAKYLCSGCNRVGYCGGQHQSEHWGLHQKDCGAYA